jgi:hypothetical protein
MNCVQEEHFVQRCIREIYSGDLFCYALYFINVRTFVFTRFISSFYYLHYLLQITVEIVRLTLCYESTNGLVNGS